MSCGDSKSYVWPSRAASGLSLCRANLTALFINSTRISSDSFKNETRYNVKLQTQIPHVDMNVYSKGEKKGGDGWSYPEHQRAKCIPMTTSKDIYHRKGVGERPHIPHWGKHGNTVYKVTNRLCVCVCVCVCRHTFSPWGESTIS